MSDFLAQNEVTFIDSMGSDLACCDAARVSFAKTSVWENFEEQYREYIDLDDDGDQIGLIELPNPEFVGKLKIGDQKLLKYLADHEHWSPLAHTSLKFRIKTHFANARRLVKHQVGAVWNEVSRRYVSTPPEFFMPDEWRGKPINAKQGSSDTVLTHLPAVTLDTGTELCEVEITEAVLAVYNAAFNVYNRMIAAGVCAEQARFVLPLGGMTEWIWTGSLVFWARVCKLRLDNHAQKEVQDIAKMIDAQIPRQFHHSWNALMGRAT